MPIIYHSFFANFMPLLRQEPIDAGEAITCIEPIIEKYHLYSIAFYAVMVDEDVSRMSLMRILRQPESRTRRMKLIPLLRRLLPVLRQYRWAAISIFVALAFQGFLEAYPIMLLRQAMHIITGASASAPSHLILLILFWYSCAVAAALIGLAASYLTAYLGTGLGADLRQRLHDHIQRLSADFFEDRRSGDLLNRSAGDVAELQQFIVAPLTWAGDAVFSLGFAFYFLFRIDWQLTLLCVPIGVVIVLAMYLIGRRLRPIFRRYREAASSIFDLFSENLAGIREIQAFTREAEQTEKYQGTNRELRRLEVRTAVLGQLLTTVFSVLFPLATVAVLWWGGGRVRTGGLRLDDLVAFLVYAGMIIRPLRGMGGHYSALQRALVSAERVFEVLEIQPQVQESPSASALPAGRGAITFEAVGFSYEGRKPALSCINFAIEPGQMVALVGPSGAGKSTLIKLLLRYYDPQQGRILVDGADLREVTLQSLRGNIGIVFQDPFLFNASLRDNIAFGRPDASPEEIVAAARAADLESFIEELADGYDTHVGERGLKLSGGQRARLAIARALLRDPRILILDEATASVDTATEQRIRTALERLIASRTTLVIAHRLSTVVRADRILVLSEGQVVEDGKHADLLAKKGLYASLYRSQFS
jgi:ATP-binding cassette, subfamily B, bacterial MsbA